MGAWFEKISMRGFSGSELAERAGVHRGHITLVEQGRRENPALEMLRKLARGLDVSIEMLVGGEETE